MSKIEEIVKKASQKKVDFLVFPELFLTGYDLPYIMEKNNIFPQSLDLISAKIQAF